MSKIWDFLKDELFKTINFIQKDERKKESPFSLFFFLRYDSFNS